MEVGPQRRLLLTARLRIRLLLAKRQARPVLLVAALADARLLEVLVTVSQVAVRVAAVFQTPLEGGKLVLREPAVGVRRRRRPLPVRHVLVMDTSPLVRPVRT